PAYPVAVLTPADLLGSARCAQCDHLAAPRHRALERLAQAGDVEPVRHSHAAIVAARPLSRNERGCAQRGGSGRSGRIWAVANLRSRPVIRMILMSAGLGEASRNGRSSRSASPAMRTRAARPLASQKSRALRSIVSGPWWRLMTSVT